MEAIEFINNYNSYLEEISQVIKPELQTILGELKEIDPHDLIKPEGYFNSESHAKGYVWSLFLRKMNNM
jgi:hypothetical protein